MIERTIIKTSQFEVPAIKRDHLRVTTHGPTLLFSVGETDDSICACAHTHTQTLSRTHAQIKSKVYQKSTSGCKMSIHVDMVRMKEQGWTDPIKNTKTSTRKEMPHCLFVMRS